MTVTVMQRGKRRRRNLPLLLCGALPMEDDYGETTFEKQKQLPISGILRSKRKDFHHCPRGLKFGLMLSDSPLEKTETYHV